MNIIKIESSQLNSILEHIDKLSPWEIATDAIEPLILVFVAAYSGYFFQRRFTKIAEKKQKIDEIHKFNEAVIYTASVLELVVNHLVQLVLKAFELEQGEYRKNFELPAQNKNYDTRVSFLSIRPLEVVLEENLLAKIPDLGKYIELTHTFYRTRSEMLQFQAITQERNALIMRLSNLLVQPQLSDVVKPRYAEILQRTYCMLSSGESILDGLLFISYELEKIADALKAEAKKEKLKGGVARLERNKAHEDLRLKLRNIFDQNPEIKDRMLHLPKEELVK